jgi:hypothetical protein
MLAGAAPLPALAAVPALAVSPLTPDPIFAALDAFRRADAAFSANLPEWEGDIPDEVGDRLRHPRTVDADAFCKAQ